jgi:hypothetical protein
MFPNEGDKLVHVLRLDGDVRQTLRIARGITNVP